MDKWTDALGHTGSYLVDEPWGALVRRPSPEYLYSVSLCKTAPPLDPTIISVGLDLVRKMHGSDDGECKGDSYKVYIDT